MNKIIKNFSYMFLGNVYAKILTILMAVYLARKFGPSYFGIISFSTVFITYFSMLANMGLQSLGIVRAARDKENVEENVDIIISLRIILSIIVFSILLITIISINKDVNIKIMIFISGISIIVNSFCLDWVFNALQKMKYISYYLIINSTLSFIFTFIPLYLNIYNNIYIVPIASALSLTISNVYLLIVYKKKEKLHVKFIINYRKYKELIMSAWPFFFSGMFAAINCNVDTLMLGFMRTDFEVGLYNSVYKLVNALTLFVSFIFIPLYPVFIEYYNEKKYNELSVIINKVRKLLYLFAIPLSVAAFTVQRETIITLYGQQYKGAVSVFTVLVIYVAIFYIRELYGYELTAWGLQKKYMNIVLISSMYNIISNAIFIPAYGIEAAAINTLISEVINIIFMYRLSRKTLYIKYDNKYIPNIIVSVACMTVIIFLIKSITANIFEIAIIAAIIYSFLIIKQKVIKLNEIKSLLGVKK